MTQFSTQRPAFGLGRTAWNFAELERGCSPVAIFFDESKNVWIACYPDIVKGSKESMDNNVGDLFIQNEDVLTYEQHTKR